ncbi:alpha/beta fold hydrolase [Arthrobacter sp. W4I7]|uniref:alpha/beta fold hydrolase n=1 Tax=Arthrobacter sp. W4I7 TaxID=3042296 RepID=UPI002787DE8A|nr:alpha/beta fold hydrolase [Arthrobacter sp. W4I7]MDQ0691431.1 pimeloyl-ACP methyl ester carboxylesterase [Arthrobacter sp. W4I7]
MDSFSTTAAAALIEGDRELRYQLRGFDEHVIRVEVGHAGFDVSLTVDGVRVFPVGDDAPAAVITGTEEFWLEAFQPGIPRPGFESLTMAQRSGLVVRGDLQLVVAPYQGALQRLYQLVRESVAGPLPRKAGGNPYKLTDNAIGRYVYLHTDEGEARVYYETAGTGSIPLVLQATAGTDGREYRHLLADPRMQDRFTMYAIDLPYHGKSLPVEGVRWWEQAYRPTRDSLIAWIIAFIDDLDLEQPYFMGTSVGGQLALDLAAEAGDRFGAFVSINGWYDIPESARSFDNDRFRTPSISAEMVPAMILGATAPNAPEADAREVYWIYRSNFPGIYAGDNDYFMTGHDLKQNGHKINTDQSPVWLIVGEYDPASLDPDHGAPAVVRNIPGTVLRVGEGLGHFAPSDDPVGFNDFIVPVLDEIISEASYKQGAVTR